MAAGVRSRRSCGQRENAARQAASRTKIRRALSGYPGQLCSTRSAMKILHIISSVGHGGAQKILADIINADRERAEHHVVSLVEGEPFFKMHPASLQSLPLQRGQISLRGIFTLRRFAGGIQPDIVHAWLYHGNFASTFIKDMSPKLVWS